MGFISKNSIVTKEQADEAYARGEPLISDQEYDKRFGLNAENSTIADNSPWAKFKHTHPIGSLEKARSFNDVGELDFTELENWHEKHGSPVCLSEWKDDGISIRLYYEQGFLNHAVTKGDKGIGEDITRNVLKMKNVKRKLDSPFTGFISAEIVMLHSDYRTYLDTTTDKKPYSNTRNGASGAAKGLDGRNCHYLTLMYYGIHSESGAEQQESADLLNIYKLALGNVEYTECYTFDDMVYSYNAMVHKRKELDFDVDGVVFVINDKKIQEQLGLDSGNRPRFKISFKFPYREVETKLLMIEWSMGKQGRLTPVAIIDPVDLGVTVARATLSNLNKMQEKRICVGDRIIVSRRGDVIPHVEYSIEGRERKLYNVDHIIPKSCPRCGQPTERDGAFLVCSSDVCPSKDLGNLLKWIEKMKGHFKTKSLGSERIEEMYDAGLVTTVDDFYRLNEYDLVGELKRVGESAAYNMLQFQAFKEIPLDVYMGALNIAGIGSSIWQYAINAHSCQDPYDLMKLTVVELLNIDGIGPANSEKMIKGILEKKELIDSLKDLGVTGKSFDTGNAKECGKFSGLYFCITGTLTEARSYYEGLVKENGGQVKGISKKTNYLLAGANVGATKTNKAAKYGVQTLTEQEFLDMLD